MIPHRMGTTGSSTRHSRSVASVSLPIRVAELTQTLKTPMRIPGSVALFKQALPLVFPGLVIGNDLSNRTLPTVSASTSWTIWYDPVTQKNRRSSAADGLLWAQGQQRDCLTVLATHTVDRVLFEATKAIGVTFTRSKIANVTSGTSRVYTKKGVILAAGSLASAPVLERSGIGRASILEKAGVKLLVDLPGVGSNLNVGAQPAHFLDCGT